MCDALRGFSHSRRSGVPDCRLQIVPWHPVASGRRTELTLHSGLRTHSPHAGQVLGSRCPSGHRRALPDTRNPRARPCPAASPQCSPPEVQPRCEESIPLSPLRHGDAATELCHVLESRQLRMPAMRPRWSDERPPDHRRYAASAKVHTLLSRICIRNRTMPLIDGSYLYRANVL